MIATRIRGRLGRAEGQVLVLGCLALLVIALLSLATVTLGHTIHERIRLQDTADAAAFSAAALEARAFNFYAFANRTQVSHYVSAMVWQSTLSFLYFTEAFLADSYGVMRTLVPCVRGATSAEGALCRVAMQVPGLGGDLGSLALVAQLYRDTVVRPYQRALELSRADEQIGKEVIPAHRALNEVLAGASTAIMLSVLHEVENGAWSVVQANDPNLSFGLWAKTASEISRCRFDRAHFREANGSPLEPNLSPRDPIPPEETDESSKSSRAKRVMGGIANATRFACDAADGAECPREFVTSRTTARPALPAAHGPVGTVIGLFDKVGQTRLLTYSLAKGADLKGEPTNFIRHFRDPPGRFPQGMMAQGDNLGADDLYWLKEGAGAPALASALRRTCPSRAGRTRCWGDAGKGRDPDVPFAHMAKSSIWALNPREPEGARGGIHWRVCFPGQNSGPGWQPPRGAESAVGVDAFRPRPLLPFEIYVANVRAVADGNHPWRGIVPFSHFEPGQYRAFCGDRPDERPSPDVSARREEDFNQPSVWVALEKGPSDLMNPHPDPDRSGSNRPALLNDEGRFSIGLGRPTEVRLGGPAAAGFAGSGLAAISRAQVYYHRPGHWAEQPNFFNPYWRPRLAPGAAELSSLKALALPLPASAGADPEHLFTH